LFEAGLTTALKFDSISVLVLTACTGSIRYLFKINLFQSLETTVF